MTPDLPFEIWRHIASYLPPGYVRGLLAVNRHLFYLAMEDRYEKFEATTTDLRTFERIQSPTRLQYMKQLEIRSSPHHHNSPSQRTALFFSILRPRTKQPVEPLKLIEALTDALPHCSRLKELTLDLYDLEWETAFSNLITTLLSQKSGSIDKLNINANSRGLFSLLNFFSTCSSSQPFLFPYLESLSLTLMLSQPFQPQPPLAGLPGGAATLIKVHKHSLHTLVLHQHPRVILGDISTLFDIGHLPHLKRLELSVPITQVQQLECLQNFLSLNSSTLECFNLKVAHSYLDTLSQVTSDHQKLRDRVLLNLHFPVLSEFTFPNETRAPLPPFDRFAPSMKRLVVSSLGRYSGFRSLLQDLCNSRVALHSFQVVVCHLSPEHLDQLAMSLPSLQSLTIVYRNGLAREPEGPSVSAQDFAKEFHGRKYTSWCLKYLRLEKMSNCPGGGHAHPVVHAAVAKCIVGLDVVDRYRRCECPLWSFIQ